MSTASNSEVALYTLYSEISQGKVCTTITKKSAQAKPTVNKGTPPPTLSVTHTHTQKSICE